MICVFVSSMFLVFFGFCFFLIFLSNSNSLSIKSGVKIAKYDCRNVYFSL